MSRPKGFHHTEETKKKLSKISSGRENKMKGKTYENSYDRKSQNRPGRPCSEETKKKLSIVLKGKFSGQNHPNWMGGISFAPYCPKFNQDLKQRVRAYFGNECVMCGISESKCKTKLSVHHVEYNKQACCDENPIHFVALCHHCHAKTNFGNRQQWETIFRRIINEVYAGKSYYTKEEFFKFFVKE